VHKGAAPKSPKENKEEEEKQKLLENMKFDKEKLPENLEIENSDQENSSENNEGNNPNPDKNQILKKPKFEDEENDFSDEDEKAQNLKKKTEKLKEIVGKATIEFVGKQVFHENIALAEGTDFKKRSINLKKRKTPESTGENND